MIHHTDEELLAAELKIDNPLQQSGLVWALPDGAKFKAIRNLYAYSAWPNDKVPCAMCGFPNHKFGFTVEFESGELMLMGSSCGAKIAGETWQQQENAMRDLGNRQYYLRLLERAKAADEKLVRAIWALERRFDQISRLHVRFRKQLPEAYELLIQQCRKGEPVLEVKEMRENEAAKYATAGQSVPKFVENVLFRHRLQGTGFFFSEDPLLEFQSAMKDIESLFAVARATAGKSTNALSLVCRKARAALEVLGKLVEGVNETPKFFAPRNLEGVSQWLNHLGLRHDLYSIEGQSLCWNDGADTVKIDFPPPYEDAIDHARLTRLSAALQLNETRLVWGRD